MHLEPLEKLPRSVREFLAHYSMIVLSILTALALEQVALALEHRHEGKRAKEEIEQEITSNRKNVEESLKLVRDYRRDWQDLLTRAAAEVKDGTSTNESRLAILIRAGHRFGDATAALKTAAWDAAVSSHAVDYLDHEDLARYSQLYAQQRFFTQAGYDTMRDNAARTVSDLSLSVLTGKAEAVPTLAILNSRVRALSILESQLSQTADALQGQEPSTLPAVESASSASH
ncbi:MAG: hypothetical protein ACJ8GJ_05585 [Vitreoscilla sp.]